MADDNAHSQDLKIHACVVGGGEEEMMAAAWLLMKKGICPIIVSSTPSQSDNQSID